MRRIMNTVVLAALIAAPHVTAPAQVPTPHFALAPMPTKAGEITLSTPRSRDLPAENWKDGGYHQVRNVAQATLLPFLPPANLSTGEAVIVVPGGGFRGLAIENEG